MSHAIMPPAILFGWLFIGIGITSFLTIMWTLTNYSFTNVRICIVIGLLAITFIITGGLLLTYGISQIVSQ